MKARPSESWIRQGIIYELFPRSFSRSGTIDGIIDNLPFLKKLGVTIIWLMPVHPIGTIRSKGALGSPYAVKNYYRINKELGNIAKFRQLVHSCKSNNLHIIIDLVIGHTAWDNMLLLRHPEWYKKNTSGTFQSPVAEWTDVVALNYSKKALVHYMIAVMQYWTETIGVDGFRCDDAGRIPIQFWEKARDSFNRNRNIVMVSESTNCPLHHRKAFDLSYGTDFYIALKNVFSGTVPASHLHKVLSREQFKYPKGAQLLRYTSNHDTNNQEGSDIQLFGLKGAKLAAVINSTIPGVPMIYNGQEYGNANRLDLFDAIKIPRGTKNGFFHFYQRLLTLRKLHPAISLGNYLRVRNSEDKHCFTFCRILDDDCILIAANFAHKALKIILTLPDDFPRGWKPTQWKNLLTGRREIVNNIKTNSMTILLPSLGYRVLSIQFNKDVP